MRLRSICGIGNRDRREQRDRVRVERVVVEVVGGRELHDLAEVHDRDPVGDVPDDRQVVRDEEVGELEVALQLLHQVDDLRLDRDVERGHRLVADEEVGVQRERAREADPLPLAAGELVRVARGRIGRQARRSAGARAPCCRSPCRRDRARAAARRPCARPSGAGSATRTGSWKIICIRLRSGRSSRSPRCVMSVPSKTIVPAGRLVQTQQRAADRRLAAARLADEPERLAALDS